jgi:hypothetical protein
MMAPAGYYGFLSDPPPQSAAISDKPEPAVNPKFAPPAGLPCYRFQ